LYKLKKISLTLLVFLIAAAAVWGLRVFNLNRGLPALPTVYFHELIENEDLTLLFGSGLVDVAENENFILRLDFDCGNIEIYHKQAGYTWRSRPSAREMELEESNALWMGNIQSPVMFMFTDNLHSMIARLGNVHNQNTEMFVFELPNGGIRVYYIFHETGIRIGYDMLLKDTGLVVDVPPNLVSDNESGPFLTEFIIFPFLGATRSDTNDTGYLFLPDGPGALVRFELSRRFNHSFVEPVYGRDLAYVTDINTDNFLFSGSMVYFPVYGIHRNDNSMMAVIHQGESLADIIGNPAYVQTGFNSAHARFSYRRSFRVITNAQTGEGFFRFTDATFNEHRSLHFYFLTGEDAGWVGMAQAYRQYLAENFNLSRLPREEMPLTLFIDGGDTTPGTLGSMFVPLTTFEQAEEILNFFHEQDVGYVRTILWGWQRRGNSTQNPNKFPAARGLGGDRGLRKMISFANSLGYSVILSDNVSTISQTGRGIRLRRDTVYNAQGFSVFGGWHLNTAASRRMFENDWQRLESYGADGILPINFGRFLMTDFNANAPMGRTTVMEITQQMAEYIQNRAGTVFFNRPLAFLINQDAVFMNMPLGGTYRTMIDETVPFYPIALHGYLRYYGTVFNNKTEPRRDILRALAWGALPSFELMYAASEDLWGLENTHVLSSEFYRRRYEFLNVYQRFRDVYYLISGRVITAYHEAGDVIQVSFEDITLYINMGTQAVVFNGVNIPALDFVVGKE